MENGAKKQNVSIYNHKRENKCNKLIYKKKNKIA